MNTTYGCSFPCSIYSMNACNAFMEHHKYIHEIEEIFSSLNNSHHEKSDDNNHWYAQLKYSIIFPQLHRNSIFLTTFGLLEHLLNGLCLSCKQDFHIAKKVKKKGYMKNAFLYLSNDVLLNMEKIDNEVEYFTNCALIRNAITHRIGVLSEEPEIHAYETLIKTYELAIDNQGTVILSHDFLDLFIQKCRLLFVQLDDLIQNRIIEVHGAFSHIPPSKQLALLS